LNDAGPVAWQVNDRPGAAAAAGRGIIADAIARPEHRYIDRLLMDGTLRGVDPSAFAHILQADRFGGCHPRSAERRAGEEDREDGPGTDDMATSGACQRPSSVEACEHGPYLIASGLTGEPTAPVIGIAGATNRNS